MSEMATITIDSLRFGCKRLGIITKKEDNVKTLESLIKKKLSASRDYGVFCCGACFRDITPTDVCPFCATRLKYKHNVDVDNDVLSQKQNECEVDEQTISDDITRDVVSSTEDYDGSNEQIGEEQHEQVPEQVDLALMQRRVGRPKKKS